MFAGTCVTTGNVSACGVLTTLGAIVFTLVDIYVIINSFVHSLKLIHSLYWVAVSALA